MRLVVARDVDRYVGAVEAAYARVYIHKLCTTLTRKHNDKQERGVEGAEKWRERRVARWPKTEERKRRRDTSDRDRAKNRLVARARAWSPGCLRMYVCILCTDLATVFASIYTLIYIYIYIFRWKGKNVYDDKAREGATGERK